MPNTQTRAHVAMAAALPSPPATPTTDSQNSNFASEVDSDESAIEIAPPLSRKEKRKQKKQSHPPDTTNPSNPAKPTHLERRPTTPPNHPRDLGIPNSLAPPMPPPIYKHPILVCSLGNPGPLYANTLHSIGHLILQQIRRERLYYDFQPALSGLVARPKSSQYYKMHIVFGYQKSKDADTATPEENFVLWQSTSLMNVCGKSVKSAWDKFRAEQVGQGFEPRLVIVHDELEAQFGAVSVRDGNSSARGHNGVKSVQAALSKELKYWRIGVGIGRPESREPAVVAKYVLSKMAKTQEKKLFYAANDVLNRIRDISEGAKYPG